MMLLLGAGLTQPCGYISGFDVKHTYSQCRHEDHDITPLDFVFEHLLNLEAVVNFLEGEHDYVPGDHPHQPINSSAPVFQILAAMPAVFELQTNRQPVFFPEKVKHYLPAADHSLQGFYADILRPPIC